ncbi:unnamed protein product [Camellia sinensis]
MFVVLLLLLASQSKTLTSLPSTSIQDLSFLSRSSDVGFQSPDWLAEGHKSEDFDPILINTSYEAAKILANLIVMGSGILARAFVQAYRQALANASKSGVAQETIQNTVRRASKIMTEQEARQILGVSEQSTWEEIAKKYDNLFENNAKNGSFYLQSKVHKAKECLEPLYQCKDQGTTAG